VSAIMICFKIPEGLNIYRKTNYEFQKSRRD
jgi:hypothetical protein